MPPASACPSSFRSIAAPPPSAGWSRRCRRCTRRRAGDRAGERRQPRQFRRCLPGAGAAAPTVPLTYVEHARNFGEHNAVMTGLRHARGAYVITMDDDLQNPPEEVVRAVRPCPARRLGRRLHPLRREAACGLAQPRQPLRQRGGRSSARQAEGALSVVLPLHVGARGAGGRPATSGPYPYIDGLIMQVTQRIDSIEVRHLPRVEGRSNYKLTRLVRLWLNLATSFSLAPLRLAIYRRRRHGAARRGRRGGDDCRGAVPARHAIRLGLDDDGDRCWSPACSR